MSRKSYVSRTLLALVPLSGALSALTCHAQSLDLPLTPREQRELSREFRPDRVQARIRENTRARELTSELQFAGSIGTSFGKASDGSSFAALPIELDITHSRSGVTLVLTSEIHSWAHDDSGTIHGVGALTALLTRKWTVVEGQSSFSARAAATFDSGSAISDPNARLVAAIYNRKLSDQASVSVAGSVVQGPRVDAIGISRSSVGGSVKVNHTVGTNDEHTIWLKFATSRRNGVGTNSGLTLGFDLSIVPDVWDATLSVKRGLSGASRTTTTGLDVARSF